jgi:type I restriction enzyme S subunit
MFHKETDFQSTLIGKIPKNWEIVRIKELGELQYGYTTSAIQVNTGTRFLRITDIAEDGSVDWEQVPYCYVNGEEFEKYALHKGDLLFARIGATAGKTTYVNENVRGIFASYLIRLKTKKESVHPQFVFYLTQSATYWSQALRQREGQLKKGINATMLSDFMLPFPPFEEQRAIVGVLGVVDLAVAKAGEVIAKTERLKKGLMQELLTKGIGHKEYKQTPIGKKPSEWEIDALPNLFNVIDYRGRTPPFSESGIPYIGSNNIRNERIILDDKRYVSEQTYDKYMTRGIPNEGDILFTTEAPLGEVAIIPRNFEFCFAQRLVALQCRKGYNSKFLMYMLRSRVVQKQLNDWATGTTVRGISAKNMKFIKIPYSTDGEEQRRIAEILSTIDEKLELEKNEKIRLERIKRGLMDSLLTGKVRIKVD